MRTLRQVIVRSARASDVPALNAILSEIIAIGGTTAFEVPLSDDEFSAQFVTGSAVVCCLVAEDEVGRPSGFQMLERGTDGSAGTVYSSTFARAVPKVPGIGTALFEATKRAAAAHGVVEIIAKIRADNAAGLAYYSKMGFEDASIDRAVPLKNGTLVDRIIKRYRLMS